MDSWWVLKNLSRWLCYFALSNVRQRKMAEPPRSIFRPSDPESRVPFVRRTSVFDTIALPDTVFSYRHLERVTLARQADGVAFGFVRDPMQQSMQQVLLAGGALPLMCMSVPPMNLTGGTDLCDTAFLSAVVRNGRLPDLHMNSRHHRPRRASSRSPRWSPEDFECYNSCELRDLKWFPG